MTDNDTPHETEESITANRRTMLKGTGAAIVGTAGLAASSGSATAVSSYEIEVLEVGDSVFDIGPTPSIPVGDEVFIFAHGWFGDTTVASQAADVATSMEDVGYEADEYVAIQWDATTINFPAAESETEDVGEELAEMLEEFYDDGGGNVRLVGHSLGGRVVLETVTHIDDSYEVETVAPIGAAADGDMVCGGGLSPGEWYDGIANNADEVRNYHSENDSTVGSAYGGFFGAALGTDGAGCPGETADNYTDVDVTDSVGSHLGYLGDAAVGADLAEAAGVDVDDGGW
ncbi:lipase/acyltransferase domain-containing protein [Natronorubrum halophilum]|uniref:lipase/acyltransferase domain-containing protein n=1 Tax=Natronorubrum halophilum TaxID=1702106 RepID=UPI0010C1E538|nr:alpha/beta hydrolase [Natronorubrum halophilum]